MRDFHIITIRREAKANARQADEQMSADFNARIGEILAVAPAGADVHLVSSHPWANGVICIVREYDTRRSRS